MSKIEQSVKTRDLELLKEVVSSALEIYNAALPDEAAAMVDTVHGDIPISMIFDDETKWIVISVEVIRIKKLSKSLPKGCDENIEKAKLIVQSSILRHVVDCSASSSDDLL